MKNFIALAFIISNPSIAGTNILDESINVNPYMLPGDSERNQLSPSGIHVHEANDFYGKTDKFTSDAGSFRIMQNWGKYFSTYLGYKGRFVTPALRTKEGKDKLPAPIGIYAEWAETTLNQSITIFQDSQLGAFKIDGGLGYNDLGDHRFADFYRRVHDEVGSPDETDQFGAPQKDHFISSTAAASLVVPVGKQINIIASYQIMNSKIFREDAQEVTLLWSYSKELAFSAKYSFVEQLRSEFYDLKKNRSQFVGAIRLLKFWTPSIMYVSSYIKGDKYGQWYLSPISLTYPF